MATTFEFPDKWPPDGHHEGDKKMEERPSIHAPTPTGFFEVTASEDLKRILVRWGDVQTVFEPANPRHGAKIVVRALGHVQVEESYAVVLAKINEAYARFNEEGRGY